MLIGFLAIGWETRQRISLDDELTYLALSQSIEHGSYRETFRATAPLHVQYPPLYPAWLATVRQGTGNNLDALRASNLLLVALALLLSYGVARRLLGVPLALGFLLLLTLNRGILGAGGSLLSEGLYLALSALALAGTAAAESPGRKRAAWVIATALAAFLTRMVGVALVMAVGTWLWSKRRWMAFVAWAVASALIVGGWFVYTGMARADLTVRSYAGDLVGTAGSTSGLLLRLGRRVWQHAVGYGSTELFSALSVPAIQGTRIDNWIWLAALVLFLGMGLRVLWGTWRTVMVYLLCYAAVLLVWTWQDTRLLVPIVPVLLFTALLGAKRASAYLPIRLRTPMLAVLVGLLAIGEGRGIRKDMAQFSGCDRANPVASPGCYPAVARNLVAASAYLRLHAAPADAILTEKPSTVNFLSRLLTERPVLLQGVPPGSAVDTLRAHGVRFVLLRQTDWLARALLDSCRELRVESPFPPAALLLSTFAAGENGTDACVSLRDFIGGSRRGGQGP